MNRTPFLRRLAAATLTSTLLIGSSSLTPPGAAAVPIAPAAQSPTYLRSYSMTQTVWVGSLKTCVKVKTQGVMGFELRAKNSYVGLYVARKVVAPKVTVSTFDKCGTGRKAKKVWKLSIRQSVFSSTCEPNVSIGAGLPWNVGVSATLACKTVNRATRLTSYGASSKPFVQNNSSATLTMEDEAWGPVRWYAAYNTGKVTYLRLAVPIQVDLVIYSSKSKSDSLSLALSTTVAP